MAVFDTFRPVSSSHQPVLGRVWTMTFGALAAWNDARLTRNALSRLSAHELDDIGLVPGDIDGLSGRR